MAEEVHQAYDGINTRAEKVISGLLVVGVVTLLLVSQQARYVTMAVSILVLAVVWHEMFHAIVAKALGLEVNFIALFIPFPVGFRIPAWFPGEKKDIKFDGTLWEIKIGDWVFVIGNLPIGGGIDIPDEQFWKQPWWKRALVAVVGPIGNMVLAFGALLIIVPPGEALTLLGQFSEATWAGLEMLVSGQVPVEQVSGPVEVVALTSTALEVDFKYAMVLFTVLINVSLAVTNMLPLVVTDGGQIVIALVTAITGDRYHNAIKKLMEWFGWLLFGLTMLLIAKDAWSMIW